MVALTISVFYGERPFYERSWKIQHIPRKKGLLLLAVLVQPRRPDETIARIKLESSHTRAGKSLELTLFCLSSFN